MSKNRNSANNAIVNVINVTLSNLLSLIAINLIIRNYGSDYNGLIATANQITVIVLIIENGFSVAIIYALYDYFTKADYQGINNILFYAKNKFRIIGVIILGAGLIVTLVYPLIVKSRVPYETIALIILMIVLQTFVSLFFAVKWRILFQVAQKEYLINGVGVPINAFFGIMLIILAYYKANILLLRVSVLACGLTNCFAQNLLFKRSFPEADFASKINSVSVHGMRDAVLQKLTMVVYGSFPVLFLSTFISTSVTSVFAIYNSIFAFGKSVLASLCAAPVNAFGQLAAEQGMVYVHEKYSFFEFIVIVTTSWILCSILIMIVPFILIYTDRVTDINYTDYLLAIILAISSFFEVTYYPCEMMLNVSGNFRAGKKVRLQSCVALVILLSINCIHFTVYGMLVSMVIANIILLIGGRKLLFKSYFKGCGDSFLKPLLINISICIVSYFFIGKLIPRMYSYLVFFLIGILVAIGSGTIFLICNYIFFKDYIVKIIDRIMSRIHNVVMLLLGSRKI